MSDETVAEVVDFLQFRGPLADAAANEVRALWSMFQAVDATQVEINPLAETGDGQVCSIDAKIQFDDNAEFRQPNIFSLENAEDEDPREVDAKKWNLNYIG